MARKKVSIIGAGKVGSTLAQILAYKEIADVVLFNRTANSAKGIALDLMESAPLEHFDTNVVGSGDYADISGSDIVVLTAGVPRKEGMSRDDLLKVNADIVSAACENIAKQAPDSILIVLTNPLDAMVYLAMKKTGFKKQKVIGMAGILDSARFGYFIAKELGASINDVNAVVLGSHGDTMVPATSLTEVGGVQVEKLVEKEKLNSIIERTRNGGAEIISLEKDSSAYYAPASALATMVESILKDKKMILPCSVYLEGEYGISGIFLGVPVVLGSGGVERIVKLDLSPDESAALAACAEKIRGIVAAL